jgi:hypothetical protein
VLARLRDRQARIEQLRALLEVLEEQTARDEEQLREIEGLLGISPQLRIEDLNRRLRGQRLQEVALEILMARSWNSASAPARLWLTQGQRQPTGLRAQAPSGSLPATA